MTDQEQAIYEKCIRQRPTRGPIRDAFEAGEKGFRCLYFSGTPPYAAYKAGKFVRKNGFISKSLDEDQSSTAKKPPSKQGGKRPGAGRPPVESKAVTVAVSMSEAQRDKLDTLGPNRSKTVQALIDAAPAKKKARNRG